MANANIEAIFPLNAVQDGVLYHTLYSPGSSLYVQQYVASIEGPLDPDRFESAWKTVIGRHQAMRSFVTWDERDQPLQVVRGSVTPEWNRRDWSGLEVEKQNEQLEQFLADDRQRGFTLDVAPLMRFALVRLGPETWRFVWTHHHIVLDGWSLGIVLEEVFAVYETGGASTLEEPVPLRNHVAWYRQQDWSTAETFWRSVVDEATSATQLGIERAGAVRPWAERQLETVLPLSADLSDALRRLGQSAGVSLSTVFRAAWALLLSRYSGEQTVTFGAAVAGRPPELPGALEIVGMFINSVPVRVELDPDSTLDSLLARLQADQMAGLAHESTPLSQIQAWAGSTGDAPLFQSLLVFENVPQALPSGGGIAVVAAEYRQESNYPLSVLVMPGEEMRIHLLHDPDRFDAAEISRLLDHLATTLRSMADAPTDPVRRIESLSDGELASALADPVAPDPDLVPATTVHELIVNRARAIPDSVAIVGGDRSISYRELDLRSGALAATLRETGIGPGHVVGVAASRSPDTVVAMVAVLRTGAAYVPVDPDAPADRRAFVLADTSSRIVVGDDLDVPEGIVRLAVGDAKPGSVGDASGLSAGPDDLAYVMYTSGSTGQPKGVMVTHANLISSTLARRGVFGRSPSVFLVVSPLFFDSSVAGLYWTLVEGGTVVLPEPDMEHDVHHLAGLIERHSVTHTLMVPSLYALLLDLATASRLASLEAVMVAGEACPAPLVQSHHTLMVGVRMFNEYGPTEATVWCTVAELSPDDAREPVSIGAPIPGTAVFVLDHLLRPTPPGAVGELCVAGPGVARGYLGRPDLTADSFVDLELASGSSCRVYRTGDLARQDADGRLVLAGRRDHQVKIRGQRIELGEIEAVLKSHPAVREAAALTQSEDGGKPTGVVAFVEPAEVDPSELRAYAAERLPRVMVPNVVVALDLPRGATGKVDRRALETRDIEVSPATSFAEPASQTERALAEIWSAVLGVEKVGLHDNFFDLGGDSILTIRIIARAHESGLSITPRQFFDHPTVAELAEVLDSQ